VWPLLASGGDDGTVRLWDVRDPDAPTLRVTLAGTVRRIPFDELF
jgi:WD40 repeat protein